MISAAVGRRDIIALLCFLLMLGGALPALTAAPAGTIEGVAKDAHGRPLPGVRLTLRTAAGRIAAQATSRADGGYRFAGIAAGNYLIAGTKAGFATATEAVAVRSGARIAADLTLATIAAGAAAPASPAATQLEEVNVTAKRLEAARAAIEPQIGASVYTVTSQAIAAQPGGENNTLNQVVLQTPGVSQDAEAAGGIHVRNEMQPEEFRINGIPLPVGLSYFGQVLSPRFPNSISLITARCRRNTGSAPPASSICRPRAGCSRPAARSRCMAAAIRRCSRASNMAA
jgi:hypothetical protein